MATQDYVDISLDIGEDFACQLLWSDSDGTVMPIRASSTVTVSSLSYSGGIATLTTPGHSFSVGDYATLTGFSQSVNNGIFPVTAVTSSTVFKIANANAAPVSPYGSATFESCRADVKDASGNTIISFKSSNTPSTQASIIIAGSEGIIQLSAPKSVTKSLTPGQFSIDIYATVDGVTSPIANPQVKLVSGFFTVNSRTTIMESV